MIYISLVQFFGGLSEAGGNPCEWPPGGDPAQQRAGEKWMAQIATSCQQLIFAWVFQ